MQSILEGVRVVEVASWTFVPSAGAVLADWGADVIKVEHPLRGDPQRGLVPSAMANQSALGVNLLMEQPNRGKRSIGLDFSTERGRELLLRLVETADVFSTNMLPGLRQRLRLDVDDLREVNPNIIYVRGSGTGVRGAEANDGGFDTTAFWARSGIADSLSPVGDDDAWPAPHRPGIGDNPGGMMVAGGVAAALFRRERTGVPSVVDVSLLGCAMWTLAFDIISSQVTGDVIRIPREDAVNPLSNTYRTADRRTISLSMFQADRHLREFCELIGRPELATDPRFADAAARSENRHELTSILDDVFAKEPLAHWEAAFAGSGLIWSVFRRPHEVHADPQVVANGYLPKLTADNGNEFSLVANPIQFDGVQPELQRAPDQGQHTDEVLLELGLTWDELIDDKSSGTVL